MGNSLLPQLRNSLLRNCRLHGGKPVLSGVEGPPPRSSLLATVNLCTMWAAVVACATPSAGCCAPLVLSVVEGQRPAEELYSQSTYSLGWNRCRNLTECYRFMTCMKSRTSSLASLQSRPHTITKGKAFPFFRAKRTFKRSTQEFVFGAQVKNERSPCQEIS